MDKYINNHSNVTIHVHKVAEATATSSLTLHEVEEVIKCFVWGGEKDHACSKKFNKVKKFDLFCAPQGTSYCLFQTIYTQEMYVSI